MARHWLITAAGGGLGREIARCAHAAGDLVLGTVRSEKDANRFETEMPGALALVGDLVEPGTPARFVGEALAQMGSLDILVNNAGRGFVAAVEEADEQEVHHIFEINFFAAVAMIQATLPHMRERRSGMIVNVTSISGFKPWSGTGIYCASKFAMEGLGQVLAQEVAGFNIRVMNVQPGALRTRFNSGGSLSASARTIPDYAQSAHIARHALARMDGKQAGDPARAAQVILAAINSETPPLNLLLGEDAYSMAQARMAALSRDMADWSEQGRSIGFPEPGS